MQDRFKFRAKLKGMDKWVYGAYLKMLPYQPYPVGKTKPLETEYKHLIITEGSADWGMPREITAYEVIPETVGQSTGLKDKNCKLIYEDDIVKFKTELFGKPKQIIWDECHYILKNTFIILCDMEIKQFGLEVIGNTYENPELLEVEND